MRVLMWEQVSDAPRSATMNATDKVPLVPGEDDRPRATGGWVEGVLQGPAGEAPIATCPRTRRGRPQIGPDRAEDRPARDHEGSAQPWRRGSLLFAVGGSTIAWNALRAGSAPITAIKSPAAN